MTQIKARKPRLEALLAGFDDCFTREHLANHEIKLKVAIHSG